MQLPYENASTINFIRRKNSISPYYRPVTKISQILLVLYLSSRGNSANLFKLQLFNWVFKSSERNKFLYSLLEDPQISIPFINMDPTVNRALQFAIADKLISYNPNTGKFYLLEKGVDFAKSIIMEKGIFLEEKAVLENVGTKITDRIISIVFRKRNF